MSIIRKIGLLSLSSLILFQACLSEEALNQSRHPEGVEILFGAATGYENGDGTRTVYSGYIYGETSRYERIDWVNEDRMTIVYSQASTAGTAYRVTGVSGASDRNSYAEVESVNRAEKLVWGSGNDHFFHAMYPATSSGRNSLVGNVVTGTIPAVQDIDPGRFDSTHGKYLPDMDYGYMVAYADDDQLSGGRVRLPFTPAMTAFEFKLQRLSTTEDVLRLSKFELVSADSAPALTGIFTFMITGGDDNGATWNSTVGTTTETTQLSSTGHAIEVNFPAGGVSIPSSSGYLDFTVFALPIQLTNLAVRLTYHNGSVKTLALKDNATTYHTFAACKKHIITNTNVPGEDWSYSIDALQAVTVAYDGGERQLSNTTTFKSTRTRGSVTEPVPFKMQYSSTGNDNDWSDTKPGWLEVSSPSGFSGNVTGEQLMLTVAAQVNSGDTSPLKTNVPKNEFDLSTINVATGSTVNRTTANCYVVQASGTYKFPLVYGNGVVGNTNNESAYIAKDGIGGTARPSSGEYYDFTFSSQPYSGYFLGSFLDHLGNEISSPYIAEQQTGKTLTAALLWEDAPGLVTDVTIDIPTTGAQPYKNAYIHFSVPQASITEGNAVIGVFADNVIAWSWHIWITSENLSATLASPSGAIFAPVDLGWCNARSTEIYAERTYYVRAVQDCTDGQATAKVLVTETSGSVNNNYTNAVYYQWGRKDPFVGSVKVGDSVLDKVCYPIGGNHLPTTITNEAVSVAGSIQSPNVFYYKYDQNQILTNMISRADWCDLPADNFWNSTSTGACQSEPVTKTIYDPCPVGFHVPFHDAFSSLGDVLVTDVTSSPNSLSYSATGLKFTLLGYRRSTSLVDVGIRGDWWTASSGRQSNYKYVYGGFFEFNKVKSTSYQISHSYAGWRTDGCTMRPQKD